MRIELEAGARIADRYRVHQVLGRGGMGAVYQVTDEHDGRSLALKLASVPTHDPAQGRKLVLAFEHEYFTLAHLAHPCVVAVHDFGVAEQGPYYTMELLDGADLREQSPMPWRRACSLLRDVASCLALLHARQLVHRDLSPRNIRCMADGRAKLIDFGAMVPFGLVNHVVGTPAYIAPEAVHGVVLDARSDLFALGGVLYFALTGQHAYPARRVHELEYAWQNRPGSLRALLPELPEALDKLVMSLLSIDPLGRPTSAAEVISHLTAIAELPAPDDLTLSKAYLATPTLIGRDAQLAAFSTHLHAALAGHGATLLVRGDGGAGRTRFLATALLKARLAGALSLQARMAGVQPTSYAAVRLLLEDLQAQRPELARETLGRHAAALPELRSELDPRQDGAGVPASSLQQRALVAALLELCQRGCLVLGVDDFERCDPGSMAVLSELSLVAERHGLLIVLGVRSRAPDGEALPAALGEYAHPLVLSALTLSEVSELLRGVFDDAPNLAVVADWAYRVGGGNVRMTLALAQFLVDRHIAQLLHESWHLPEQLHGLDLPESVEQAMRQRIAALSTTARTVASALALVTPLGLLEVPELVLLLRDQHTSGDVLAALDELSAAGMVDSGAICALRDAAVGEILRAQLSAAQTQALHRALGEVYVLRGDVDFELIAAHHFARAGLLARAQAMSDSKSAVARLASISSHGAVFGRSREGAAFQETLLEYGLAVKLPPPEVYMRRKILMWLAAVVDPALIRHAPAVIAQLERDVGLVFLTETDPALDLHTRATQCMQRALALWDQTPAASRGLHPLEALVQIGTMTASLSSLYARTWNTRDFPEILALVAPFRAIPAIAFVESIVHMARDSIVMGANVTPQRRSLLAALEQPIVGIEPLVQQAAQGIVLYFLGLDLSLRGDPEALRIADRVDSLLNYQAFAWHVRTSYQAHAGDAREMEQCRRRMEALALRDGDIQQHLRVGVAFTLFSSVWAADLLTLTRELPLLELEAERFPGWVPWRDYARGAYHALRGELALARVDYEAGLRRAAPGEHHAWWHLAAAHLELLVALGEHGLAEERARELDATVQTLGIAPCEPVGMSVALALAEAHAGRAAEAMERLQRARAELVEAGYQGLSLGMLHETMARVALLAGDAIRFDSHAQLAGRCYRKLRRPGLVARYARLVDAARAEPGAELLEGQVEQALPEWERSLRSALQTSVSEEPAQRVLRWLLEHARAGAGHLFSVDVGRTRLLATHAAPAPDAALHERVEALLCSERDDGADITTQSGDAGPMPATWSTSCGDFRIFPLRCAAETGVSLRGIAVLECRAPGAPGATPAQLAVVGKWLASFVSP